MIPLSSARGLSNESGENRMTQQTPQQTADESDVHDPDAPPEDGYGTDAAGTFEG